MLYWVDFCVISDNCMLSSSSKSTFKIESSFTGLMDTTGSVSARLMGQTHKYIHTDTEHRKSGGIKKTNDTVFLFIPHS